MILKEKNFNDGKIHYYIGRKQFEEILESNPKSYQIDQDTLSTGRNRIWHIDRLENRG